MLGVMLQFGGFGGFNFADMLNQFEQMGFFRYVLPFLLIFALIYALTSQIPLFKENKGAAVIVALAVGLLSLQFDYVPAFFQAIFPNLGIGLSVLLAGLILAGAFISGEGSFKWIFFGLGALIFLVVFLTSFSSYQFAGSWQWSGWWADYGGIILFLLMITGVIIAVTVASKKS
jgi:hypothetical protein